MLTPKSYQIDGNQVDNDLKSANKDTTTFWRTYSRRRGCKEEMSFIQDPAEDFGAHEVVTQKKYHIACGSEPLCNALERDYSTEVEDIIGTDKKNYMELAVLGGNVFRLLMGKSHPKYYCAMRNESAEEPEFARVSDWKENIVLECKIDEPNKVDTTHKILKNLFEINSEIKFDKKPVIGAIAQIVFSQFLGDGDVKNFDFLEDKDIMRVLRYDPEYCFQSKDFWYNINPSLMFIHLKILSDPKSTTSHFSQIQDLEQVEGEYDVFTREYFKLIFSSSWRQFEAYAAFARIIEISDSKYCELIFKHISLPSLSRELETTFKNRLEVFREAAFLLPEFARFNDEYTKVNSPISKFWHAYFGPMDMASSTKKRSHLKTHDESYTCYKPNYREGENPVAFQARLHNALSVQQISQATDNKEVLSTFFRPTKRHCSTTETVARESTDMPTDKSYLSLLLGNTTNRS